jgi:hypothetical protein
MKVKSHAAAKPRTVPTRNNIRVDGPSAIERRRLRQRIRTFYGHLNAGEWNACFQMIDPALRSGGVNPDVYAESLSDFRNYYGSVKVFGVAKLTLHPAVKGGRYGDQEFASGVVIWLDSREEPHRFNERWIKSGNSWFTRMVGLVSPDGKESKREMD